MNLKTSMTERVLEHVRRNSGDCQALPVASLLSNSTRGLTAAHAAIGDLLRGGMIAAHNDVKTGRACVLTVVEKELSMGDIPDGVYAANKHSCWYGRIIVDRPSGHVCVSHGRGNLEYHPMTTEGIIRAIETLWAPVSPEYEVARTPLGRVHTFPLAQIMGQQ